MKYRKEIDGLRALAVLPVILFHAGFAFFGGGFVGVDIFFVISGYLITTIIIDAIDTGSFSLITFYERRSRRILPALFFMMLCTLPFAWLWMMPQDLISFSHSLIAVSLFSSNFLFYSTSNYFDTSSELNPLLHTWSLAVEEQYYILFPLFLMMSWKLGKNKIILLLVSIAIVSVFAAEWGSKTHPSFTFYLLPTRAFEILIGTLISFYLNHRQNVTSSNQPVSQLFGQIASLVGLIFILYAIFVFDSQTPSPSLYTLIPTVGAGLIIIFSNNKNIVGKLLGSKPIVGIGLISYSTYLWHQPLLSFAKMKNVDEINSVFLLLLCLISLAMGYLSWKYVETPFRNKQKIKINSLVLLSTSFATIFILIGLIVHLNKGFENRLSEHDRTIAAWQNYDFTETLRRYQCFMEPGNSYVEFKNECFGTNSSQAYLIWGDSYAAASSKGLRNIHSDVIQLTASGCPPIIDKDFSERPNCSKINSFVKNKIKSLKPKKILLQSKWNNYVKIDVISDLSKTIKYIKHISPDTEIIIIGNTPQWKPTLPEVLIRKKIEINKIEYLEMKSYDELIVFDRKLINLANKEDVQFVSMIDNFCIENKCLVVTEYKSNFWLTTWDSGHLTEAGSIFLFDKIKHIINN